MSVARVHADKPSFFRHRTRLNPVILFEAANLPEHTETSGLGKSK